MPLSSQPRILLLKTSSMGDIIHCFPALTDAQRAIPGIRFDWVVEEAFAGLPGCHPAVDKVIPVALRRWRKQPFKARRSGEWARFRADIKDTHYDLILDAQGLAKSAFLTRFNTAPSAGYDRHSIREPLASLFYNHRYAVDLQQHAVERMRKLFALALGYEVPEGLGEYGLSLERLPGTLVPDEAYLVFCHGTTWQTKLWPESYWKQLTQIAAEAGMTVYLPWGNSEEQARAHRIAADIKTARVCPKASLTEVAGLIGHALGVVAVDTGLGHLAAALSVPTTALYGPTRPGLTGNYGAHQSILSSKLDCAPCMNKRCRLTDGASERYPVYPPCFEELSPERVWTDLQQTQDSLREASPT
ncbi:lipopolysaccharide heptosyltransferase I [Mangrovitalea sediminis]|uniref:lipopolysaccharide heptosyltransferase I n=1 Tax=Mangrovitalea sediminis TaxID=1982043 RepID=UPI000BE606FF|nr:lipopolysaccharide heptosyltransferase I [Mangrovitalea sediminis]